MTSTACCLPAVHRPRSGAAVACAAGGVALPACAVGAAGQYWYWFSSGVPAAES